ncbi:TonB-dependent receptor [Novosphingobium colocasiae]|uniref:TonB-dependent receptor n=1 Tax=Novosphingobium colocasiae TaxID=1256513 RepID=A0A918PPA2_9SPHN|nr:TonB-dependent receptor [Novosphingobium colocasiae]GGZ16948.1 hypothetical protein GCM10011614_34450 [Novosphingobium colocasiae]
MKNNRFVLAAGVSLLVPFCGHAQTRPADQEASAGVGEIIVTANKREQNLNRVGLAVAAISGDTLLKERVTNVSDLARLTPGLTFAPTPTSTPVYTLRGVGFFESSLAAYPDVSLYLDQVPLPLPIMSSLTAFDLERVEVLKGPQGTLFGNNATGGAINMIAAKPTNEFKAGVDLSYGRFNTFEASGFVSGPLSDTLRARLAVKAVNGDGWQKSYTRNDTLGKQDNVAGRLILDWDATPDVKFSLNLNGWRNQDDAQAAQKILSSPQNPVGTFPVIEYPNAPANPRAADWGNQNRPRTDNEFKQASLRSDIDLGSVTLTSITSYADLKFLTAQDQDGTDLVGLEIQRDDGRIKSFSQEVRLSNGASSGFRWVLGANYERTNVRQVTDLDSADSSSTIANGFTSSAYSSRNRMRNYAAFGNIEMDLADTITVKAGIRQTKAKRRYVGDTSDSARFPISTNPFTGAPGLSLTDFFNVIYGAIYGTRPDGTRVVPLLGPLDSIVIDNRVNPDGTPVNPATYLKTGPVPGRLNENSTSWSLGVDYKPSDSLLLYLNLSKGYKAGSFPHVSGAIVPAFEGVKQESVLDLEGGVKAQLLDRRLSISAGAFYYDYRNKQLRAKFVDPIFGGLDKLVNVPKSEIKGAEIEFQARPTQNLTFSGSATYLDAKVKRYMGVVGAQVVGGLQQPVLASFAGVRLPFSPKLSYTARADYEAPLSDSLVGHVGVGISGQSSSMGQLSLPGAAAFGIPSSTYRLNARTLVNANLGISSADDRWSVTVWGKNIFNKYYWNQAIQAYDTVVRYAGRPAEYGVTVGLKM